MANTAFEHSPTITVPGTGNSTDNAVVLWNGTTGNNFSNSTIIVGATTMGLAADTDLLTFGSGTLAITGAVTGVLSLVVDNLTIDGNTITSTDTNGNITLTPNGSGSVVADTVGNSEMSFNGTVLDLKNNGTQSSIKLYCETGNAHYQEIRGGPHSGATSYTMILPHVPPTANQVLTTASISSNVAVLDWADTASSADDTAYASSWNGVTSIPPSKNAVYDKIESMSGARTVSPTNVDNAVITFVDSGDTFAAEANLTFDGTNLTVGTGNVIIGTAGKGIDFSAQTGTASPGTVVSELLDHYEEGTWTPCATDETGHSPDAYTTQEGAYTKIGNRVFITGTVTINGNSNLVTTQGIRVCGLPFTPQNSANLGQHLVANGYNYAITAGSSINAEIVQNDTIMVFNIWDLTTGISGFLVSEFSSDGRVSFSGHYAV